MSTSMNSSQNTQEKSVDALLRRLRGQPELYDLHTHLLGMGNTGFWIKRILMSHTIMPTNDEFRHDINLCQRLCRLVWDTNNTEFLNGQDVAQIIQYLIDQDYPNGSLVELREELNCLTPRAKTEFHLIAEDKNGFERELKNRGLSFKQDFCYDVVLKLDDLADGFGVKKNSNDLIQTAVEEKLGFHTSPSSFEPLFRHWIIFNARMQYFEVAYGITVEQLRNLIEKDANAPREANKLAMGHIINAFSMCDAQGTIARPIDFHGFHGMFTPEFCPRRFALKDSVYSQRLDVLAHLLFYVLHRYDTCHPRVSYCELSIGVGDLTRAWVFDVLCSFSDLNQTSTVVSRTPSQTDTIFRKNTFRQLLLTGHFPELEDAVRPTQVAEDDQQSVSCMPKCTYKFLAGFNRQKVQTPLHQDQLEALNLLDEAPQMAIHLMLNEISKSARNEPIMKDDIFYSYIEDLEKITESARKNSSFHNWVVGFDLFGDEMGFPYCPFVARPFIDYILERRKDDNTHFGLRIHCGENVPYADANAPAYRHFVAHMYIVFRCLRYLQHELQYGIRIGHGIAFQRILDGSMRTSKHRKSSVLLAEIQNHARHVFKTIAFEVNITSNEYLLGQALRKGDFQRALQLDALLKLNAPVFLGTDDDGIWPIDNCPESCASHHSLSGEYCRAISSKIIHSVAVLEQMFDDMKRFCFYSKQQQQQPNMPKAKQILPHDVRSFTVVMHPDIIQLIIDRCRERNKEYGKFFDDFSEAYPQRNTNEANVSQQSDEELRIWNETCRRLAPIAYISYCAEESERNPQLSQNMKEQYCNIFENGPGLERVLKEWKSVYQQLIDPNIIQQSLCVTTDSDEDVFFSEEPFTTYTDKKRPMKDLIDYLNRRYHKKIRVHAFTRHINIKATEEEIKNKLKRACDPGLHVLIYSNKDKDKYEDFDLNGKFRLEINQKPSQRTDCNGEQQQNGLYAVCPHGSAATAFLHFIGKELTANNNTQLPIENVTTTSWESLNEATSDIPQNTFINQYIVSASSTTNPNSASSVDQESE